MIIVYTGTYEHLPTGLHVEVESALYPLEHLHVSSVVSHSAFWILSHTTSLLEQSSPSTPYGYNYILINIFRTQTLNSNFVIFMRNCSY